MAVLLKVENVTCWRRGLKVEGTLHLTNDHLILRYELPHDVGPIGAKETAKPHVPHYKESWITYPMISHCIYRPAPPASHHPPSVRIRCRDFAFVSFHFLTDQEARSTYDMVKNLTCKRGKLEKLYAFHYVPPNPERAQNGWSLYDTRREFARLGISTKNTEKGWRITDINKDYAVSGSCEY
jgi:myotubularin-related protein 6/7/8